MAKHLKIFTDGGSRGNPGPAAIGVVIYNYEDGVKLAELAICIGRATNNTAEYSAVLEAVKWIHRNEKPEQVNFILDSELVVRQLSGIYKVKDENLRRLFDQIKSYIAELEIKCKFTSVPREQNREADALVNRALDSRG